MPQRPSGQVRAADYDKRLGGYAVPISAPQLAPWTATASEIPRNPRPLDSFTLSVSTIQGGRTGSGDHWLLTMPISVGHSILQCFTYENANVAQTLLIITTENKSVLRKGSYDSDFDVTVTFRKCLLTCVHLFARFH